MIDSKTVCMMVSGLSIRGGTRYFYLSIRGGTRYFYLSIRGGARYFYLSIRGGARYLYPLKIVISKSVA
jgi:hypothetical protein